MRRQKMCKVSGEGVASEPIGAGATRKGAGAGGSGEGTDLGGLCAGVGTPVAAARVFICGKVMASGLCC